MKDIFKVDKGEAKDEVLTIRLPHWMLDKINKLAKKHKTHKGKVVRQMIGYCLDNK